MSRWVSVVPLFLLLGLTIYFAIGLSTDSRTVRSVLIDKPLPAFELPKFGADGETVSAKTLSGHVSLLNIFASWCIACKVEHPLFVRLTREKRVAIYGLAWKDKPDELKAWLDELGNPFAAIADDAKGRVAIDLGVTGAPETYIIDKRGRIRYKHVGVIDDHMWRETLEPIVARLEAEE